MWSYEQPATQMFGKVIPRSEQTGRYSWEHRDLHIEGLPTDWHGPLHNTRRFLKSPTSINDACASAFQYNNHEENSKLRER